MIIMKKLMFSVLFVAIVGASSTVFAQIPGGGTPSGNGDTDFRNDSSRMRTLELERIKREAFKNDPNAYGAINTSLEAKFPQVKEDFESIQISEAAIIKAYTTGKTVDHKMIEKAAKEINKKSKRLDENLFLYKLEAEDREKLETKNDTKSLEIKDVIVSLDKALGSFVTSKIFQDHKLIDTEVAKKARIDLANILKASETLAKMAGKMK
jgi:hypothetical protein